jgi:hypothetical protein
MSNKLAVDNKCSLLMNLMSIVKEKQNKIQIGDKNKILKTDHNLKRSKVV